MSPAWLGSGRRRAVKTVTVLTTRRTTRAAAIHRETRRITLGLLTHLGYLHLRTGVELSIVPTYSYACADCGHQFDIYQSFSEEALTNCSERQARLRKVCTSVGVVFNGAGFSG